MNTDFIMDTQKSTGYIANYGTCFYSIEDEKYCHFIEMPLEKVPGSAVTTGYINTTDAMDSNVVADSCGAPHIFSEDKSRFQARINLGLFKTIIICSELGCNNLSHPGSNKCFIHK